MKPNSATAEAHGGPEQSLRWHWDHAESVASRIKEGLVGELRERGLRPSGLPVAMPQEDQLKQLAEEGLVLMRQWQQEPPSDDLATREEILEGLQENPVSFRESGVDA